MSTRMERSIAEDRSADAMMEQRDEIPLVTLLTVLLRRWRPIFAVGFVGGVIGLTTGLASTRQYASSALFIPQGSESGASGLATAASQLGIRMPASGGSAWGPPIYVHLIRSPGLLDPIASDTLAVEEQGNRRVSVSDLLHVRESTEAQRIDATIKALQKTIDVFEERTFGGVRLVVLTPWPSVSHALASKMLDRINDFNIVARKAQATAERQFAEAQAIEADSALRAAEQRLAEFRQRNRVMLSPELQLESERLTRTVGIRTQLYVSMLQGREEARIREVRNVPMVSIVETPRRPIVGEPRGSAQKAVLGGIAGGIVGLLLAFMIEWASRARQSTNPATHELLAQIDKMSPRFLRRML